MSRLSLTGTSAGWDSVFDRVAWAFTPRESEPLKVLGAIRCLRGFPGLTQTPWCFWVALMELPLEGRDDYLGQHRNSLYTCISRNNIRNAQVTDPVPDSRNSLSHPLRDHSAHGHQNLKACKTQAIKREGNRFVSRSLRLIRRQLHTSPAVNIYLLVKQHISRVYLSPCQSSLTFYLGGGQSAQFTMGTFGHKITWCPQLAWNSFSKPNSKAETDSRPCCMRRECAFHKEGDKPSVYPWNSIIFSSSILPSLSSLSPPLFLVQVCVTHVCACVHMDVMSSLSVSPPCILRQAQYSWPRHSSEQGQTHAGVTGGHT